MLTCLLAFYTPIYVAFNSPFAERLDAPSARRRVAPVVPLHEALEALREDSAQHTTLGGVVAGNRPALAVRTDLEVAGRVATPLKSRAPMQVVWIALLWWCVRWGAEKVEWRRRKSKHAAQITPDRGSISIPACVCCRTSTDAVDGVK